MKVTLDNDGQVLYGMSNQDGTAFVSKLGYCNLANISIEQLDERREGKGYARISGTVEGTKHEIEAISVSDAIEMLMLDAPDTYQELAIIGLLYAMDF